MERDALKSYVVAAVVALLLAAGGFVVGLLTMIVAQTLLVTAGVPVAEMPSLEIVVGTVALQGIGFGTVALLYLGRRSWAPHLLRVRIPSLGDLAWTVGGFVALIALIVTISVVLTQFGIETADNQIAERGAENPEILLLLVPLSFLLIGPGEELLFRGMIQGRLREVFGPVPAIGLASVVFAIAHFSAYTGEGALTSLSIVFLLSLVLGSLYEHTGNLVVPALVHGAYNAFQFVLLYLVETNAVEAVV